MSTSAPTRPEIAVVPMPEPAFPGAPKPVKGVRSMTPMEERVQRWSVLWITLSPVVILAIAIPMLWGTDLLGWSDVIAFAVTYMLAALGVTVGFHRLLTHQSYDAPAWLRTTFAVLGMLSVEGPVLTWVADHRRHHAFSDHPGDPHSPHLHEDESLRGIIKGLWHAHAGWLFKHELTEPERWTPDLLKEPGLVAVNRLFFPIVAVSYALPALIGFALTGTAWGAFTAFIWGGVVRIFILQHVTWSTNSICHYFGSRPYDSNDESTNNWPLAIFSMGESWHNTHHAFPSSAVHGLEWWQVDISAMVIRGMEKVGLVKNVRVPSEGARERKRRQPDAD